MKLKKINSRKKKQNEDKLRKILELDFFNEAFKKILLYFFPNFFL